MRRMVIPLSLAALLTLALTAQSLILVGDRPSDWLAGWDYRTPLYISNNTTALTDQQISVTLQGTDRTAPNYVNFDQIAANGADLRFTDLDGKTLLPYWIQSWNDSTKTAAVWVRATIATNNATAASVGITVGSADHTAYGLSYPLTYEFDIPASSSGLTAWRRYTWSSSWTQLTEKTTSDFFNGIEAVRFDYAGNKAYVSAAFSSTSDTVFIKILNSTGAQVGTYSKICTYYDNRVAVVTSSGDDWNDGNNARFVTAATMLGSKQIWLTPAIITNAAGISAPTWAAIQAQIDAGYLEPAAHGRVSGNPPYADYDGEISGCKSDLLTNLNFPVLNKSGATEYLYVWIEPGGNSDATIRTKVGQAKYLVDRDITADTTWATWDSANNLYNRIGFTVLMGTEAGGVTNAAALNAGFDSAYAGGQIYHLMFHPANVDWAAGQYADLHTTYISGKKDVWYAALGHLYAYHFTANRAITTYPQRVASSGKLIYLYAGNSTVASAVNYSGTFTKDYGEAGLAGLWHFDEANGNALDSSGNNNTGSISGATRNAADGGQWADQAGVVFSTGHYLQFDGNDSVNCGNGASLNPTVAMTLESWVNFGAVGANQVIFGKGNSGGTGAGYTLYGKPNNTFSVMYYNGSGAIKAKDFGAFTAGVWYHLAVVYDGSNLYNYLDGVLINSRDCVGLTASAYNLYLGRLGEDATWYLTGALDEVRIYNRALGADEILAHYQRRKYVPAANLFSDTFLRLYHW